MSSKGNAASCSRVRGLSLPQTACLTFSPSPRPPPLQPSERGPVTIRCDERLRELFGGAAAVELGRMAEAIKPHLSPPEPVKLTYTIK